MGQSRMDNNDTQAASGTRRRAKNITQKTKRMSIMDPSKKPW